MKFHRTPFLRPDSEYARRKDTKFIVIHCSATPPSWNGGAEEIREWHVHDNHWLDIGYHFVIKRDGTIENGRPHWAVGSGVAGHNASALHICMVGGAKQSLHDLNHNGKLDDWEPENNFTAEQYGALEFLVASLKRFTAPKAVVQGHRDFPNTGKDCPSFNVKPWWAERQQLADATVQLLQMAQKPEILN